MANTSIFSRLQRLFSTDVVIRNVGGNQVKTIDSGHIQASGEYETNSLIDRFNRVYSTAPSSLYGAQFNLNYQYLRTQLYSEYDLMDQDAIIASALDIIADESTLKNDMGEVLQIRSSNEDLQKILYNLFYDVLNIEFNLWMWVRQMCKYGDFFLKLEIAEKFGVFNVIPYTAYHIERQEGFNPENPAEVKYRWNPDGFAGGSYGYYNVPNMNNNPDLDQGGITYDNYEMAHFRMVGDVNYLPYGRSYIEPARKLFKQYTLMEDAMLIHRIARAPEKRVFYINVGSIPPNEIEAFMQKTISNMKRTPMMDEKTGEYNLKYNMQNMLEDFYIPVRGNDNATKIDTTPGLSYDGIQDVEYLRDKLFAALKIPKAFLGYDETTEGKATLAAEDIRFARTIDRIQRIMLSELNKIALVHLYTQGYTDESLTNFELSMTSPSIIFEQEKVELLKSKSELAGSLLEQGLIPSDWIYHNVYQFSEDQYDEYRDLVREDAKRKFRVDQIKAEGNDPVTTGKSYGTPHDLASLYGLGRTQSDPGNVPEPEKYAADDPKLGRPQDSISNRGKQDNNFGKDPLGTKRMKDTDKNDGDGRPSLGESESAHVTYLKNKEIFKSLNKKKLIFEEDKNTSSLLDESQLKS
ncbi:portal protein [Robiginitalea sp.]|nr:portal protein [Robiginitalea sp.]|tara:strand:+ start:1945 stop:3849 length:1905 start_codon:yes stop_codon:yes gene_type:complete